MPPDWIDLDGVVNMRDVGGLPTSGGGSVASGVLIRSDNLQELTPGSVDRLIGDLGVTDIVDLRTESEVHVEGDGPLRRVRSLVHHHHSLFRSEAVTSTDRTLPWHDSNVDRTTTQFWGEHYLGYLRGRPDSISAALGVLAGASGATIVHCAAGKDRTGTVVGLALDVAGVPHEAIIADYLASGERIEAIMTRLLSRPAYAEHLASHTVAEQVPVPQAMEAILTYAADEFGGAAGWLQSVGWTQTQVARLRERLRG
ncbi:MAG: tyrosine-protein phosphatase [Nostocoides sp.]